MLRQRTTLKAFAQDDLKLFATKIDMGDLKDTVVRLCRGDLRIKVTQVLTKLERSEGGLRTRRHIRDEDTLHKHDHDQEAKGPRSKSGRSRDKGCPYELSRARWRLCVLVLGICFLEPGDQLSSTCSSLFSPAARG